VKCALGVVIVAYNSKGMIGRLLGSVPTALDGVPAELVVVDNDSADGTAELVEQLAHRVVRSPNGGFAAGINRGVRELPDAEAILVLNPDVVLLPGSIRPLLTALDLPGTGIVAPRVLDEDGSLSHSLRRRPTLGRAAGLNWTGLPYFSEYVARPAEYERPRVVDWALGAALLFSRECFDRAGGWDESFFLYSEETDFSLRARDLGFFTRYEPASSVVHTGGGSGRSDRTHVMQIVNRVRLYRRRHPDVRSWLYAVLTVLSECTWALRGGGRRHLAAVVALLRPSLRPTELACSHRWMPS
jgi:N-acetylglucosaminyl-diphospho-decaprenol L-rhamnosyltransferase